MSQRTIVVPVDFTPDSDAALDAAAHEARRTNAALVLMHAIEIRHPLHPGISFLSDEPTEERGPLRVVHALEARAARVRARGVSVWTVVRRGPAWLATIELVEACGASSVVLGARGRSHRPGLGDNAEKVARICPVPVLLIQAGPAQSLAA